MTDPNLATDEDRFARYFETAHLQRSLGRRAMRGIVFTSASSGVRFLLETGRIVVLARLLEPTDYGLVAMVTVVTGLVAMFQDLGLNMSTVTRDKITHAQVSTLFWLNVAIGIALSFVTMALSPLLAWFYEEPRLIGITLAIAPNFFLAGISVQHQALLRRQMRFGALSMITIFSQAVGVTIAIGMALYGASYWSLVGMTVGTVAARAVAVWIASGWPPGRPQRRTGARAMMWFGSNVTGQNLITYLSQRFDQLMLGWWWGPEILGLYTRAFSLVDVPISRGMSPIGAVVLPSLSRLADQPDRYRRAYLRVLEKLALTAMPLTLFLFFGANWLIPVLLGPKWVDATPMFQALVALGLLRPLNGTYWWVFVTQNRANEGLQVSLMRSVGLAAAVAIGLPWGGLGVALALSGFAFIGMPFQVWYLTRRGPIRAMDIYRTLAAPAAATVFALVVLGCLAPFASSLSPIAALAATLVTTISAFFAALCALPSGRRAMADTWSAIRTLLQ